MNKGIHVHSLQQFCYSRYKYLKMFWPILQVGGPVCGAKIYYNTKLKVSLALIILFCHFISNTIVDFGEYWWRGGGLENQMSIGIRLAFNASTIGSP